MTENQAWSRVVQILPHRGQCTFPDAECGCGAARERRALVNAILNK